MQTNLIGIAQCTVQSIDIGQNKDEEKEKEAIEGGKCGGDGLDAFDARAHGDRGGSKAGDWR